jgi:hypothetical protein
MLGLGLRFFFLKLVYEITQYPSRVRVLGRKKFKQ